MDIHEFQAKALLGRHGIPVPKGRVARAPEEAQAVARELGGSGWAVKAQILAGDRGRAGGVVIARSSAEVLAAAHRMLGSTLVTSQTGPAGRVVSRVYIEQGCVTTQRLYFAILVDPTAGRIALLVSSEGGTEIEQLASQSPEAIHRLFLSATRAPSVNELRGFVAKLGLTEEQTTTAVQICARLYTVFMSHDAALIELNPVAVTDTGELVALDAKMSFDDNALYRQPELESLRQPQDEDPDKLERARHGFNYVELGGDIGCLVTGAGLALATIDIIELYGGEAANFLDLPPVATRVEVAAAFNRVIGNPKVKALLVNAVGGGLTRCDVVAEGIITAVRESGPPRVPVIVRLDGTNKEVATMLLDNTRIPLVRTAGLADAAQKAVDAAKGKPHPGKHR